jgi:hypothetical protein
VLTDALWLAGLTMAVAAGTLAGAPARRRWRRASPPGSPVQGVMGVAARSLDTGEIRG